MSARGDVPRAPAATLPVRFADPAADRAFREQRERVERLAASPAAAARVVAGVELASGAEVAVAHGLGRVPVWVRESCVRGATTTGRVEWVDSDAYDPAQYVVLKAVGWGATITVSVAVM